MFNERSLPPPVMQAPGSLDCGLCATKYILNRSGMDPDLEDLRTWTAWGQGERRGNWPTDLVTVLMERFGFDRMNPPMVRQRFGHIHADNFPVIRAALREGWIGLVSVHYAASIGHYVVIDAIDDQNRLLVTCSIKGRSWWTAEEFLAVFCTLGPDTWWMVRKEGAR